MRLARYVALGDSVSIDDYPTVDRQEALGLAAPVSGLGAASLLYRNDCAVWPEFRGRDLLNASPGVAFQSLACDGATTSGVLKEQLPLAEPDSRPALVTVTVGGNDLLQMLLARDLDPGRVDAVLSRVEQILARLAALYPVRTVLFATVYDPTDGASGVDLMGLRHSERARALFDRLNAGLRALCSPPVVLADVAERFLGHGLSAPEAGRWYWRHAPIEPSARGASEVRRLWLELLGA